jgi:hypothetical protein
MKNTFTNNTILTLLFVIFVSINHISEANARGGLGGKLIGKAISRSGFSHHSQESQEQQNPNYVRQANAPNGYPWPKKAAYCKAYEILNNTGLSEIRIDNAQNNSDVFVKLKSLPKNYSSLDNLLLPKFEDEPIAQSSIKKDSTFDNAKPQDVRHFFIPARSSFTLNKVTAGNYEINYRDLVTGNIKRTQEFSVNEIHSYQSIRYSSITMTLYKTEMGTMQTYPVEEKDF